MANERYILKPLTNEDGRRGYRMEIDEFLADNEMTNLFLVALAELQKNSLRLWKGTGKPDWLTYYSLAGIHGYPRDEWNGFENKIGKYGYCHHSENTFPTWHRPYMFLYESAIYGEMVNQAKAYPSNQQKTYLDAAARFRLPYWDLIMPRNEQAPPTDGKKSDLTTIWGCPAIFKPTEVFVKLPKDDPKKDEKGFSKITNPLAFFTFPKDQEWAEHKERNQLQMPGSYNPSRTARVPTRESKNETDNKAVDTVIQRQAAASALMVWQMLNPDEKGESLDKDKITVLVNEERSWESFANDRVVSSEIRGHNYSTVSLESFHDGIHVLLGTGRDPTGRSLLGSQSTNGYTGHMGNPAFAAFDPIFWMHHNNIERLLALFQALYPEKYTNSDDSAKPLYPFMNGKGRECYKSTDELVKNYWGSGFAIPGDKKPDSAFAEEQVREKVKQYLTDAYYWASKQKPVPDTLPDWPKKLEGSWALYGANAVVSATPAVRFSALTVKNGVPEIVSRKVALHVESPTVQDKIVEASKVIEKASAVDSSLPKGALTGPSSVAQPPIQLRWNAHIKVRKFAFKGSFSIHLFVGHVKDDQPERYMTKRNEVGFTGVFASSLDSGCANCAKNQEDDIHVEDVVPLTTFLYDYLEANEGSEDLIRDGNLKTIPNLEPDVVVPFLQEHLQWRIIDLGSNLLVGQEQQAKLEITVTSRQFLPPSEGNLMGVYGPYTEYPIITNTKPGGYGYNYASEL